ncbi:molybdate ABC transporter ATP-binding protein ModF [Marinomonas agarivorans]|nr:molybdate ABC transporter ATP-binding protein ModF [Marinomonas agarivorans]
MTSAAIQFHNLSVQFDDRFTLHKIDWQILPSQHWVITGQNGTGKSALAACLCGYGQQVEGKITGIPNHTAIVSFEVQAELIAAERKKDDADITDVISLGTPVKEILETPLFTTDAASKSSHRERLQELVNLFEINSLLERSFRQLSTGESRKVLLIRALASDAELLVLDEPFDGLDNASLTRLQAYLDQIHTQRQIIMVLNRLDEFPDFITHIAYMEQGQLTQTIATSDQEALQSLQQMFHLKTSQLTIPVAPTTNLPALNPAAPLVELKNIRIKYTDTTIIEGLNWRIDAQQHWQLSGPNGSGKTALLSLITGDHPQCYVNDIFVFGFQRGNGESIWQIKQYIGYVSTALQWEYRVSISVRNVIISGFYDSIGLYGKSTEAEKNVADQWLDLLSMKKKADMPFNQLSYGDQRLLLIARAMVKQPALLILDEPCLGLDDLNRQLVLALIEKICASGQTTVIYVNHHAEDKINGIQNHLMLGPQHYNNG